MSWILFKVRAELERLIQEWEDANATTLPKILKLGSAAYATKRTDLLETIQRDVTTYIQRGKEDGMFTFDRIRGEGLTAAWRMKPL